MASWRTVGMVVWLSIGSRGQAWGTPVEHNSAQGTRLIGEETYAQRAPVVWFPRVGWADRDGKPFSEVFVRRGSLFGRRGGPDVPIEADATVTAHDISGKQVVYRVKRTNPPPPTFSTPDTTYYTLVDAATGEPYCHPAPNVWVDDVAWQSDADRGFQAVPVAEVWNRLGTQGRNGGYFTLACMSGAIAKCYRWGYHAWNPNISKAHVQACTRMAMADYCGLGESHTIDGTPIRIYDLVQSTKIHPLPQRVSDIGDGFETAWTGGSAEPRDLVDWNDKANPAPAGGALCLTKKRWETIPIRAEPSCPNLADPRMQAAREYPRREVSSFVGEFCDYAKDGVVEVPALEAQGALLINTSSFADSLLSVWRKGAADRWSTTHLVDGGVRRPGVFKRDLTGVDAGGYAPPAQPLGSVFRNAPIPHSLQETLGLVAPVPLSTYRKGSDSITTTNPPTGVQLIREGWIYPCAAAPPVGSVPLYHYVHDRGGPHEDHETTTTPPPSPTSPDLAGALPNCPAGLEGYLPRFPGL